MTNHIYKNKRGRVHTSFSYLSQSIIYRHNCLSLAGPNDTSILHHAFISIFIALWAVITHYVTILCLFSLILQGLHEEGECRQLDSGLEKEQNIRDLFCTTPKVLKLHESQFWNILKILGEESTRGGPPTVHEGGGRTLPPGRAPASSATWKPPDAHLLV